jgi:hypothetical protein
MIFKPQLQIRFGIHLTISTGFTFCLKAIYTVFEVVLSHDIVL